MSFCDKLVLIITSQINKIKPNGETSREVRAAALSSSPKINGEYSKLNEANLVVRNTVNNCKEFTQLYCVHLEVDGLKVAKDTVLKGHGVKRTPC